MIVSVNDCYAISPADTAAAGPGTVDLFRVPLTVPESTAATLRRLLSDDERARADRFVDPRHGVRFTAARGALRLILAEVTGTAPESVEFVYGRKGKPALASAPIEFNMSHSGELAVVAVANPGPVGIDVERFRDDFEDRKVARRFFSAGELADLDSLDTDQWQHGFYACWTRKEAYMKAVGDGFSIPLNTFRVSVAPDQPPALLEVQSDPEECVRWVFKDVPVPAGYRACVVARVPFDAMRQFDLRWT